jgi:hypothetical protein
MSGLAKDGREGSAKMNNPEINRETLVLKADLYWKTGTIEYKPDLEDKLWEERN